MTEGDCPTGDIELVVRDAELLLNVYGLTRERFVDFEDVDVIDLEVILAKELLDRRKRADAGATSFGLRGHRRGVR